MKDIIQTQYIQRLQRYAALLHGNEPPGLIAKLAIYSALIEQHEIWQGRLWKVEPVLYPLMQSAEIDLHLATARLLERPSRSDRSLFRFLEFCLVNRANIEWQDGAPPQALLQTQLDDLEGHRATIDAIMGRRDKFFAHLDKRYFADPAGIYSDFPLDGGDVVRLVNCVIAIVALHQHKLTGTANFHMAEFYRVAVDNMVRNLSTGRSTNFPGQLD